MKQAIGFANKYYTLWSIDTQPVYTTDAYGKHWLTGHETKYHYHQNISFDLEKAKALHPTLEIMEDLKGKTSSWTSENKEDLCPQIMKFGKYFGANIDELLATDFQYIVWICENKGYTSNGKYASALPIVQAHFKAIEDAENKKIADINASFETFLKSGACEFAPEKNLRICDEFAYVNGNIDGLNITFKFEDGKYSYNEYNGFPYGLPIGADGKSKRIKGKVVRVEFTEDKKQPYSVIVNSISIVKQPKLATE